MSDNTTQRLFVAMELPEAVQAALRQAQSELRERLPVRLASWTRPENMHLTLRFLGDVAMERMEALHHALRGVICYFGRLELVCEQLGCFPDTGFPRVIWARVRDEQDRLPSLVEKLNAALLPYAAGPAEPIFVGHVTLARPRRLRRSEAGRIESWVANGMRRHFGSWTGGEVHLMLSELSPSGSRYARLATFQLSSPQPA